jgi:hypothetical protein
MRMGQGGSRLPGLAADPGRAGIVNRDDDRFWKGGLVYVNHGDPAILVGKRFGVGWTLNFGNARAWLLVRNGPDGRRADRGDPGTVTDAGRSRPRTERSGRVWSSNRVSAHSARRQEHVHG